MMRKLIPAVTLLLLSGCVTPDNILNNNAKNVQIRMDMGFRADQCEWKGEVIGSEGHWYSYWFYSNDLLTQGAVNAVKNQAHELGANTIFTLPNNDFQTSVTVFGSAYYCE
ncbi:DUF4156 domain-containing protein [Vibrio maerlii]|uniref:DUF4156 domain-containing protein n=1 Tax=Vibrio maerlii TaxID=2231648 RepID=UPI000E3E3A4E|nr:DUF4156 domain-containing protein [Vibrio maerlii]